MFDLIRKINLEDKNTSKCNINSIAFNQNFIAYTIDEKSINFLDYTEKFSKDYLLQGGHYNQIKVLKFSNNNENLRLCSCSIDYIICWNINKIIESGVSRGNIIAKNLQYEPVYCCFHPSDEFLMICNGNKLCFYDVTSGSNLGEIKCKDFVNSAEFCLFNPDLVVVNNQAAYFSFYRYSTSEQLCCIKCELSTPYMNACSLVDFPIILTTSANDYLFVYDASLNDRPPNLIKSISLKKLYLNYLYKNFNEVLDSEVSMLCLGIKLLSFQDSSITNRNKSFSAQQNENHFKQQFIIVCATPICIFFIDLDSAEIINLIDFKINNFNIIPQLIEFHQIDNNNINLAIVSIFQSEIDLLKCQIKNKPRNDASNIVSSDSFIESNLSVLTQEMLLDDSPLKRELTNEMSNSKKPLPSMQEYVKTAKFLKKDSPLKDKPITFNSKIKSSGYSAVTPKQKLFQPKTNKSIKSASLSNLRNLPQQDWAKRQNSITESNINDSLVKPQFEFEMPNKLFKKFDITDNSKAIFHLKFSDDGRIIASGNADNMAHCLYSDNVDKNSFVFCGHKDYIRYIDISHDGKYLITSSNDKTCKVWSLKKPNDLLLDLPKNFTPSSAKQNSPQLVPTKDAFKKDIASCNFFYMDKFIIISNENRIYLYNYFIDFEKSDVQSYLNNSICKLIKTLDMTYSQSITCTSAINSFYSYLVFCGGTDKSLEVFDLNKCQSSLIITDAHSRAFHQIYQNSSEFNQHSYDLFLTNSIGDGIKLWDLRTTRCVKKFDQHVSRALNVKVSQSSCSNYIATGSEDRSVYVYDIRMNGLVQKYSGFTDTVMATAFHPRKSELYCGTLDGKLYQYKKI